MRIKTLSELENQFETLSSEDQQSVIGGERIRTPYGEIDVDIAGLFENFVSDNDPNTIGGGSVSFYYPESGYRGGLRESSGAGDNGLEIVGTLLSDGYYEGGEPTAVYYDYISGGYYASFDNHSILTEEFSDISVWDGYVGDYYIRDTITTRTYFDNLTGGYVQGEPTIESFVDYTGIATTNAEAEAAREEEMRQRQIENNEASQKLANDAMKHSLNSQIDAAMVEMKEFYANPENDGKMFIFTKAEAFQSDYVNTLSEMESIVNGYAQDRDNLEKRQKAQSLWNTLQWKVSNGEPGEAYSWLLGQ